MMTEKQRVVLIVGYGRSGSTLLDRLLGQTDGFVSVGEFYWLWRWGLMNNELCACGSPIRDCTFWRQVLHQAFGGMDAIDLDRIISLQKATEGRRYMPQALMPGRRRVVSEYLDILARLYSAVSAVSGAEVVVDSSKFAARGYLLTRSSEVDLHIVHVVRDSRAVAYSWSRRVRRPEVKRALMPVKPAWYSAIAWSVANASAGALGSLHPRYILCRYEDLARRPGREIRRILRWMGMAERAAKVVSGRRAMLGPTHMVAGNPMRFRLGAVTVAPDLEWRRQMPGADRAIVEAISLPLLLRYGY